MTEVCTTQAKKGHQITPVCLYRENAGALNSRRATFCLRSKQVISETWHLQWNRVLIMFDEFKNFLKSEVCEKIVHIKAAHI